MKYTKMEVAKKIDHTYLKPEGSINDIKNLCEEALRYNFKAVVIAPDFVEFVAEKINDTEIDIGVVAGFPLGFQTTGTKVYESGEAIEKGATEVDMVVNISAVKDKRWERVENDIKKVGEVTGNNILKVIFETCYLTEEEIKKLTKLCNNLKEVNFIKTSTGFGSRGATVEDVKLMNKYSSNNLKIKASGGIRSLADFKQMIKAGASRIGTSSGVEIVEEVG